MKTYFPYYWKRIGAVLVFIAILISLVANVDDFRRGFYEGYDGVELASDIDEQNYNFTYYFSKEEVKPWITLSLCLSILGFTLYLLSKEKVEDEFYQQLRAKCLAKSLLYTWIYMGIVHFLFSDYSLNGFYILQIHLFFYTLIYVYQKRRVY